MAEARRTAPLGLALSALALFSLGCDPPERREGQWPISFALLVESAQAAVAPDPGESAYRRTCIACHGADGRGSEGKLGADFTRADGVLTKPDSMLLTSIREGVQGKTGLMPAHRGLLTEAEVAAVLGYVRKEFGKGVVPAAPDAPPPDGG